MIARLFAVLVSLALVTQQAFAGASTVTGKDAAGATKTFVVTTDGSGNFVPQTVLCDGTAAANCVAVDSSGRLTSLAVQSGTWNVTNISGTVSLPTGAATSAKQPALGTAGSASTDVISVQGIASMTPLLATLSGTNNITTLTTLTGGGVASGSADSGNPLKVGGKYNSTPVTLTDGNRGDVQLDANGYLKVNVAAGGASGGTSSNFGSAFPTPGTAVGFTDGTNMVAGRVGAITNATAATNLVNVNPGCQYNATPVTVTDTRYQGIQCDVNGFMKVNVTNANANGQATMANSSPVVMASNQSAIAAAGQGATGSAPPAGAQYIGGNGSGATGGLLTGLKTCDSHAKYDASDNGSKTLVTGVSGRKVYVCGYILATGGTATNLKLREGSDADCATNGADLTPAWQLVANDKLGMQSAFWTGLAVSTNAYYVCVNASAGNAHQAEIWYTIQ